MPDSPQPHIDTPITDPHHLLPAKKSSAGPLFGIIIILVLLVIGAFYIWGERLNEKRAAEEAALQLHSSTTTLPDIIRVSTSSVQK